MVFCFHQQSESFEICYHSLASLETVQPGVRACRRGHARVLTDHANHRQLMAPSSLEIVWIVRGCYLDDAGPELRVHNLVENDGNLAIHQRQLDSLAAQV